MHFEIYMEQKQHPLKQQRCNNAKSKSVTPLKDSSNMFRNSLTPRVQHKEGLIMKKTPKVDKENLIKN